LIVKLFQQVILSSVHQGVDNKNDATTTPDERSPALPLLLLPGSSLNTLLITFQLFVTYYVLPATDCVRTCGNHSISPAPSDM
jgi:hypothetical protein